jgi:dihydroflavonol-4-reductase
MKAFVTGGTGFLGRPVVRRLVERGYEVYALTRSDSGAKRLATLGARPVRGDITDVASMRQSMQGSDVVFHIAGWYEIGARDWMKAETINVGGTRKVLRLAHELKVPKIIYTSTVAVFGDTKGKLVDESFQQGGPFLTEYDRTKWLAHYKVAVPLIEKGAPIIIVIPGVTYGPGDKSPIGHLMRQFYEDKMRVVPGPESMVTYAHVEDIAEGHLLAMEKGRIGESYILAGPAIPLGEMFDFWAQLTGKRAPLVRIPAPMLKPFGPVIDLAGRLLRLPADIYSQEAVNLLGVTYIARANKARAELDWKLRSLHEGMSETFAWIAETQAAKEEEAVQPAPETKFAGLALAAAAILLVLWLLGRRGE